MPRIPKHELDELKSSVSLLMLAESQGHKLKKQGKDYVMLCPFHAEKTPSMVNRRLTPPVYCCGCGVLLFNSVGKSGLSGQKCASGLCRLDIKVHRRKMVVTG